MTRLFIRAQHNDRSMGEMEPAHSFNLTLRGYQKQALLFVPLLLFKVHCWYLYKQMDVFFREWYNGCSGRVINGSSMEPVGGQTSYHMDSGLTLWQVCVSSGAGYGWWYNWFDCGRQTFLLQSIFRRIKLRFPKSRKKLSRRNSSVSRVGNSSYLIILRFWAGTVNFLSFKSTIISC